MRQVRLLAFAFFISFFRTNLSGTSPPLYGRKTLLVQ